MTENHVLRAEVDVLKYKAEQEAQRTVGKATVRKRTVSQITRATEPAPAPALAPKQPQQPPSKPKPKRKQTRTCKTRKAASAPKPVPDPAPAPVQAAPPRPKTPGWVEGVMLDSLAALALHRWGRIADEDDRARDAARFYRLKARGGKAASAEALDTLVERFRSDYPDCMFVITRREVVGLQAFEKDRELPDWVAPHIVFQWNG